MAMLSSGHLHICHVCVLQMPFIAGPAKKYDIDSGISTVLHLNRSKAHCKRCSGT